MKCLIFSPSSPIFVIASIPISICRSTYFWVTSLSNSSVFPSNSNYNLSSFLEKLSNDLGTDVTFNVDNEEANDETTKYYLEFEDTVLLTNIPSTIFEGPESRFILSKYSGGKLVFKHINLELENQDGKVMYKETNDLNKEVELSLMFIWLI